MRIIETKLFEEILQQAGNSSRKRSNFNFHTYDETYQRFLNVLLKGTYVCPHKHVKPPKAESFLILKGEVVFFIFDDTGKVLQSHRLSASGPKHGIDVKGGVWHSLLCLSETAICFEGKTGPYDPKADKIFAEWAPREGEAGVDAYMKSLLASLKE
ncbi:MAG: WbuC family cupin fold metalloprotein [Spirochaetota bacterium]